MNRKVFRYLLVTLLVILINVSPLAAATPHEKVDDGAYDPMALLSYFQGATDRAAGCFSLLSSGSYGDAAAERVRLSALLAPVMQTTQGLASVEREVPLSSFYPPAAAIGSYLATAVEDVPALADDLALLGAAGDPLLYPSAYIDARERLSALALGLDGLEDDIMALAGLGVSVVGLLTAYASFAARLGMFDEALSALEEVIGADYSLFSIRVSELSPSRTYDVYTLFFVDGAPVRDTLVTLFVDDAPVATGTTDTKGRVMLSYRLPNAPAETLSFQARSSHGGTDYVSNTVVVDVSLGTVLTLDRTYQHGEGKVSLQLFGTLTDAYGLPLAGRPVAVTVSGTPIATTTDGAGTYLVERDIAYVSSLTVTAYAEYHPIDGIYRYARSPTVQIVVEPPASIFDRTIPSGLSKAAAYAREHTTSLLSLAVAVIVAALGIAALRRRPARPVPPVPEAAVPVSEQEVFRTELSLLGSITSFKDAVIVGYGALIDLLERIGALRLSRDTTHRDIDETLRRLTYTRDDAPVITKSFELSRYSSRRIGFSVYEAFFAALTRVSGRMGGRR